jgi:hypothetical protein
MLGEMSRLDHLGGAPPVRFRAGQQSSTDRRAQTAADPTNWFANDDYVTNERANLVRVEETDGGGGAFGSKRYVLLDERGPGAVVRIWTASPAGTLRIFIDGDPRPALEADMARLLSGQVPPFVPPFGQVTAMGHSLYFPFPFRERCVVTVDSIVSKDPFSGKAIDKLYYQIGTRTYGPREAKNVRSYSAAELERAGGTMARVARELRDGPPAARSPSGVAVAVEKTTVAPGRSASATLVAPPGGGVVTRLRLFTHERDPTKLRSTYLIVTFDDEQTIQAPLVDFFGTGPGWNPYSSLPMTVGADGTLLCRFPMPFRRRAHLEVRRQQPGGVEISGEVVVDPRPFDSDSLLFHARWHPAETVPTRPFRDWNLATIAGRGHLVGTVLNVNNPPGVAWWGEGDEKIYRDGEAFPSIFGTGTEDYFGYAWSSTERFAHAYHAQTSATGPGFAGGFSMNRFHILDPIPFGKSLRFDLEVWHWSDTTVTMDALVYWYARPQGGHPKGVP